MIYGNPLTLGGGGSKLGSKTGRENRTYTARDDGLDGYSSFIVNVEPSVIPKIIREDGIYYASGDSVDGYSVVTVSVEAAEPATGKQF